MAKTKQSAGPLTDAHLRALNKLLQLCVETGRFCKQCEECDIDVTPEMRKNDEQQRIAAKIKAKFFPESS